MGTAVVPCGEVSVKGAATPKGGVMSGKVSIKGATARLGWVVISDAALAL